MLTLFPPYCLCLLSASGPSTSSSDSVHLTSTATGPHSSGSVISSPSSITTAQSVLMQKTTSNCETSQCSSEQTSADVWLFVLPALAIIVFLLSVTLMVLCRKRSKNLQTASAVGTEPTPANETTRITEEEEQWRSADVEIYLAYVDAISRPATATIYHQAPDDDDDAKVNLSCRDLSAPLRGCSAGMNDVLYSVIRTKDSRPDELVYSNVF